MNNTRANYIQNRLDAFYDSLPPEVAQRVREKNEEDAQAFVAAAREWVPSASPKYWAKRSCRKCNGTGIRGTVKSHVVEQQLKCDCTDKNYTLWLIQFRKFWNELRRITKEAGGTA